MPKKILFFFLLLLLLVLLAITLALFTRNKGLSKTKIIEIAAYSLIKSGIRIDAVDITYDERGKLWSQRFGRAELEDKSSNRGILNKGLLKNYQVVYFDFKEPVKDVWVFVDKDSGKILKVYKES